MVPILAGAGLPMIFLELPAMLCALVPVVFSEIVVARKILDLAPTRSWKGVLVANLASTLLGFPVVWGLLAAIQLLSGGGPAYGLHGFWSRAYAVTIQAPWLIPYESDFYWMIPLAALYLLIPAFFASVYIERWICRKFWRELSIERMRRFSWLAHFVSYPVILLLGGIYYLVVLRHA